MLIIKTIQCNMFAENCYIVSDDTKECMIIDCGAHGPMEQQAIADYIKEEGLKPTLHILTHGHLDHIIGSKFVFDTYGINPCICERDAILYKNLKKQAEAFGIIIEEELPVIGRCLNDNDEVSFGSHTFKCMNTPGHSKGGMCYYCANENIIFTGDTLFRGSIGRTDLEGGSMFQIIQSLRMLTQLPDDTRVLPGHGQETTIGYEGSTNPYLDR